MKEKIIEALNNYIVDRENSLEKIKKYGILASFRLNQKLTRQIINISRSTVAEIRKIDDKDERSIDIMVWAAIQLVFDARYQAGKFISDAGDIHIIRGHFEEILVKMYLENIKIFSNSKTFAWLTNMEQVHTIRSLPYFSYFMDEDKERNKLLLTMSQLKKNQAEEKSLPKVIAPKIPKTSMKEKIIEALNKCIDSEKKDLDKPKKQGIFSYFSASNNEELTQQIIDISQATIIEITQTDDKDERSLDKMMWTAIHMVHIARYNAGKFTSTSRGILYIEEGHFEKVLTKIYKDNREIFSNSRTFKWFESVGHDYYYYEKNTPKLRKNPEFFSYYMDDDNANKKLRFTISQLEKERVKEKSDEEISQSVELESKQLIDSSNPEAFILSASLAVSAPALPSFSVSEEVESKKLADSVAPLPAPSAPSVETLLHKLEGSAFYLVSRVNDKEILSKKEPISEEEIKSHQLSLEGVEQEIEENLEDLRSYQLLDIADQSINLKIQTLLDFLTTAKQKCDQIRNFYVAKKLPESNKPSELASSQKLFKPRKPQVKSESRSLVAIL